MRVLALAGLIWGLLSPSPVSVAVATSVSSAAQVVPGTTVSYSVQVTAPSGADEVEVGGALPQGLAFAGGEKCVAQGAAVLCELGDLAAGETAGAAFEVDTAPSLDAGDLSVTMWTSCQGCDASAPATAAAEIVPQADLTLDEDGPSVLRAGKRAVYTLTVQNEGPSDSRQVVVEDRLPSPLTFVSGDGCDGQGRVVRCSAEVVRPGAQHRFQVVVAVPDEVGADRDVVNAAVVRAATEDTDPSGDTASVRSTVEDRARLTVSVSTDTAVIVPGRSFAYTVEVFNAGPSPARDVIVDDLLPEGFTLVEGTSAYTASPTAQGARGLVERTTESGAGTPGDGAGSRRVDAGPSGDGAGSRRVGAGPSGDGAGSGRLDAGPSGDGAGSRRLDAGDGAGSWRLGTVPAGEARRVTVQVNVDPTRAAGVVADTASVTCADCGDPAKAGTHTIVRPSADVEVGARVSPERLGPGDQAVYHLTLTNRGPSAATGMTVTDRLPEALAAAPVQGCSLRLDVLTCAVATLAPGETRTWAVDVRAPSEFSHPLTMLDRFQVTLPESITDPDPATESMSVVAELVPPEARWPWVAGAGAVAMLALGAILLGRRRRAKGQ